MDKRYHFIAIGGAVMHQLAIYLLKQGNRITGSDDIIFDPAKSTLSKYGLLPTLIGWDEKNISYELDGVILGMHAKQDNPELIKAQQLGIKVYSFPEFIYMHSHNKIRVVIAGSHGKTSITSMIMHILKERNLDFDYLVGSGIKGFDTMVKISDAPIIILEGDEYLSSPIDSRSKFLHYYPHIAIISGIAWDHINVFPTFESYLDTFREFIKSIKSSGYLIFYNNDDTLKELVLNASCQLIPYEAFSYKYEEAFTIIEFEGQSYSVQLFGQHNIENMKAALIACQQLNIPISIGLKSLESFAGAAKRLEPLYCDETKSIFVYRDFAHAPSKLKATLIALKDRYHSQKIIAIFELHTYSSLQENFLPHYKDCLQSGDVKVLFIDNEALKIKNRPDINDAILKTAFNDESIIVLRTKEALNTLLLPYEKEETVFAFMSSGNFGGFNIFNWMETKFVKTQ